MTAIETDFVVLGGGCGGSVLATILASAGRHVVLADTSSHPRFALGESTTPLGDQILHELASAYEIPEWVPLTRYGLLTEQLPELVCGKKRGFSYFDTRSMGTNDQWTGPMLVAASSSDASSDTHWLRSDVDQYLLKVAKSRGAQLLTRFDHQLCKTAQGWTLTGSHRGEQIEVRASFLIDATGTRNGVVKTLDIEPSTVPLRTRSRAVFAHFRGIKRIEDILDSKGITRAHYPFRCDDAAVHHILPMGWMWQLPFDDGSTSIGLMIDSHCIQDDSDDTSLWKTSIEKSWLLKEQFAHANIIRPTNQLCHTGPLQRLANIAAGDDWAALPSTVGMIDPLHSTGIAHTFSSVRRLADTLLSPEQFDRRAKLDKYSVDVIEELRWIDELVACCYRAKMDFRLWCLACLVYFAVVTSREQTATTDAMFLGAHDELLRKAVREAIERIDETVNTLTNTPSGSANTVETLRGWLEQRLAPWNRAGLFHPNDDLMYHSTAAPGR